MQNFAQIVKVNEENSSKMLPTHFEPVGGLIIP